MVTVYTKSELEEALKAKTSKILIKGEYANEFKKQLEKKKKLKKRAGWTMLGVAALSVAAIPFTGGTSLAAGATTMGLMATAGSTTISLTAAELAIAAGFTLGSIALLKGYKKVKFNPDGSIEIEK